MGRKPDPPALQKAKGETRPCRENENVVEFPSLGAVPDPPKWMNRWGKELWKELAPHLYAQKIMTVADVHVLGHLCQLHGDIVAIYRKKLTPNSAQLNTLKSYFCEFGMTPVSRTRRAQGGGEQKGNRFGRNGAQAKSSQAQ